MSIPLDNATQDLDSSDLNSKDTNGNVQAAVARTATRALALYFSRPVRLFRPSKVSGWQSLRGLALRDGSSLTPQYVVSLMKNHGFMLIPKHFLPPMVVNALLGTVLWAGYAESFDILSPYIGHHTTINAACSGAIAGGLQAVVAAPAENVRLLFETGYHHHSWSHAWKEVFRGIPKAVDKETKLKEIREMRSWVKEVREMSEMAARGWNGWGWGVAKDMCGFSVFFAIFEVTRRLALRLKTVAQLFQEERTSQSNKLTRNLSKTIHGATLVAGGVVAGLAYETAGRPWDVARRAVELRRLSKAPTGSISTIMFDKIKTDGLMSFFSYPDAPSTPESSSKFSRRVYIILRTLGRVGPWGVGFLVWEIYGPGLSN